MNWVQSIVFCILGAAITACLVVLFFPLVWQRALYLANKAVRMEIPVSLNEIEVERDFLMAEHATKIARLEELLKAAENRYTDILLDYSKMYENNYDIVHFEESLNALSGLCLKFNNAITVIKPELNEAVVLPSTIKAIKEEITHFEEINQQSLLAIRDLQGKIAARIINDSGTINHKINDSTQISSSGDGDVVIHNINDSVQTDAHLETLKIKQANTLEVLREQMKMMAAMVVANVAEREDKNEPILELVQKAENSNSLASLIEKNIKDLSNNKT